MKNKNQDLSYKLATSFDADGITELVNRAYRSRLIDRGWTNESDLVAGNRIDSYKILDLISKPHSVILLCHKERQLIACVHLYKQNNTVILGLLTVVSELQGQGIGKQILEYAEQYAWHQMQAEKIEMEVISQRSELIAFYQRRGYQLYDEIYDYPLHLKVGQPLRDDLTVQKLVKQKSLC